MIVSDVMYSLDSVTVLIFNVFKLVSSVKKGQDTVAQILFSEGPLSVPKSMSKCTQASHRAKCGLVEPHMAAEVIT